MVCRENLQRGVVYLMKQRHLLFGNETDFATKIDSKAGFARVRHGLSEPSTTLHVPSLWD